MIETITAALAVGTFWFWLLLALASIIIIACTESEHYHTPSIVAIILGIIYWKDILIIPWPVIAIGIGIFAIGGVIWSAFKWLRYVAQIVSNYKREHGDMLSEQQMALLKFAVSVSQNKARITGWIAFWPWSAFWTVTGDFFNMLYDSMFRIYENISNRGIKKFTVKIEDNNEIITHTSSGKRVRIS